MKSITVVEINDITEYPPVQNLIRVLLHKGYNVNLIGTNIGNISTDIASSDCFVGYELHRNSTKKILIRILNRLVTHIRVRKEVSRCMANSDYLWTTSMLTVRELGKGVLKYKNILQLMELAEHGYYYRNHFKFPVEKYARKSWKTVVPEINRAYIQKVMWNLNHTPIVLPNDKVQYLSQKENRDKKIDMSLYFC